MLIVKLSMTFEGWYRYHANSLITYICYWCLLHLWILWFFMIKYEIKSKLFSNEDKGHASSQNFIFIMLDVLFLSWIEVDCTLRCVRSKINWKKCYNQCVSFTEVKLKVISLQVCKGNLVFFLGLWLCHTINCTFVKTLM